MKKGSSNRKGHAFENMIAKRLSLWWTDGERDDVFIRSDSSGARATARSKVGKKQFGQYGDIQAADPIGQPLMDLCVIECKDGYAGHSIADLLDKEPRHRPAYEEFIEQVQKSSNEAQTDYWLLIARRRGRQIMIYMDQIFYDAFCNSLSGMDRVLPIVTIITDLDDNAIVGVPFTTMLSRTCPRRLMEFFSR